MGLPRPRSSQPQIQYTRGDAVGPNPTDRGKPGTKRHLLVERGGLPLAAGLTGANRHDSTAFAPLLDAAAEGAARRPAKLHADKGDDYPAWRAGRGRAESQQRLLRPRRHGAEPHRQARRVVRHQEARRAQRARRLRRERADAAPDRADHPLDVRKRHAAGAQQERAAASATSPAALS